jgi:HEPN domain-containing protein
MTEADLPKSEEVADEGFGLKQSRELAATMDHWLVLFDADLLNQGVPPSQRPLRALLMLFREGAVEVRAGEDPIAGMESPSEHTDKLWFRILFDAVEHWYVNRYGSHAMKAGGTAPLIGAVMIHGAPFVISLPANRSKVETVGETSWMYFEEGLGEGEDATYWIVDGPDLSKLDENARGGVVAEATHAAEVLRFVEFRRVTFRSEGDHEVQKLIQSTLTYLGQAAERLASFRSPEIGPAWFDLQMANEAALKAVIRLKSGTQPKIHPLDDLLKKAGKHGVSFDASRLAGWPSFHEISDWRYGQGNPQGIVDLYSAYRLTLDLVQACMSQIIPGMKPGFGVLIKYAPWKAKDATGNFRE